MVHKDIHCSKTGIAKDWQEPELWLHGLFLFLGDHGAISMLTICKEAPTLSQEQDKVAETTGGDIGCETTSAMKAA